MICHRLGRYSNVLTEEALTYITSFIAKSSGDARLALSLTSETISYAATALDTDILDGPYKPNVIKIPHVRKGIIASGVKPTINIIESLPSKAKVVLAILTSLHSVSKSWSIVSCRKLKRYCSEACRHEMFQDDMNTENFNSLIELLKDTGLIETSIKSSNHQKIYDVFEEYDYPLRVGENVGCDEVEIALDTTLFVQGSFYSKLRDYVRANDINNF